MASVRNMGLCPCPRCLIKKTELSALGTPRDDTRRANIRVNSQHFRTKVSLARDIIYRQGYRVNADVVNILLKEESLVPTTVCPLDHFTITSLNHIGSPIECIPHQVHGPQHFHIVCCGSDAWVWVGCLQGLPDPSSPASVCLRSCHHCWIWSPVSFEIFSLIGILLTTICFSFRMVPTFGLDTIRKFTNNVSGLKQLAARDFEDILQVWV